MQMMRWLAIIIGVLVMAGEAARWLSGAGAGVNAVDDVVTGVVLMALGTAGAHARPALHAAGWALFAGVMLSTLVLTLGEWLTPPGKPSAAVYLPVLGLLTGLGLGVSLWWSRR